MEFLSPFARAPLNAKNNNSQRLWKWVIGAFKRFIGTRQVFVISAIACVLNEMIRDRGKWFEGGRKNLIEFWQQFESAVELLSVSLGISIYCLFTPLLCREISICYDLWVINRFFYDFIGKLTGRPQKVVYELIGEIGRKIKSLAEEES